MRQIVTLRLENNNLINVIADVAKPQDARKIAVDNSARLLGNNSIIMITNQSKIVSSEKWEQSRVSNSQTGNKLYRVAFFLNNVTQCVDINAVSVKSAYNNIKIKFGIEENLFMIIYDMTQSIKKKSAMEQSLGNYRNGAYISKLLKDTANKTKTTEETKVHDPVKSTETWTVVDKKVDVQIDECPALPDIDKADSMINQIKIPREQVEISKTSKVSDNTVDQTANIMSAAAKVDLSQEADADYDDSEKDE